MKLIIGGRGSGKTVCLIALSHELGGYIVVRSEDEKRRVFKMAREMGVDILNPVSYSELPFYRGFIGKVLIDDPTQLLERIVGAPIDAISMPVDSVVDLSCNENRKTGSHSA